MKKIICLAFFLGFTSIYLSAQVTFTHTLNADFTKGITENVLVKNDGIALPFKKSSIIDWTSTTNLPQNLSGHQMASWRNFVFLSGGFNGTNYNNYVYMASVNATGIGGWTQLNSLPDSLGFHVMLATNTRLFVIGGKKGGAPSNKIYVAPINDDGTIGAWSLSAITLPQPLWGHTATLVNGFLYVAGGTNLAGSNTALSAVYYAKVKASEDLAPFSSATSLPEARNAHSMVKYNGKLYILGGYDNGGIKKTTVYYSTINANGSCGVWSTATPLPTAVSNHVSTCANGIITVIGGEETTILTNKFYHADIDNAPSLTWELSDKYLYDRTKNASAFIGENQIIYTGGTNLSGSPVNSIRYAVLNPSASRVKKGIYLSSPFFVGAPKNLQKLTYSIATQAGDSYELLYRLAGADQLWGDWISAGTSNPANINQSKSYIQYMFRFLANSTNDIILSDLTLTISGYTQLCGNLDAMAALTTAGSPYWATCNIAFSSGTHVIQPGVTIYFSPNTGLDIGEASVNFGGTVSQPVKLSFYDTQDGMWNGVYFQDASDAVGVTSQLTYTTIEKAGNGTNNANLWCYATNQPVISNCTINNSVGHGVRLESSNLQISNTIISNNTESGVYLNVSNPILTNVTTKYSGYAGIYYASTNLTPVYINTKSENNLYGIYSPSPDNSFAPASATALQLLNNSNDIAVNGGVIYSGRTWKYFPKGYVILGDITVNQGGENPTLIIAPGNGLKFMPNTGLYIGGASNWGGQLSAVGKADSLITFTAYNNLAGGWNGLYFNDGSDYNSTSSLRHCVIEKGNDYNIFSVNSNEPHLMFSTIRNSANYGIKLLNSNISIEETTIKKAAHGIYLDNSSPSLVLTTIDSIQTNCVILANATATPNYFQCFMKNSKYGINYPYANFSVPTYSNITFSNLTASISINGGEITTDQTWNYNSLGYAILGNMLIAQGGYKSRLTIKPGNILKFAKNAQVQVAFNSGYYDNRGGELFAEGKSDSLITFTALNDSAGGWNGIYFHDFSDWIGGSVSSLKYCTIQKAGLYNIWCSSTTQPAISNCTIKDAAGTGLISENSLLAISNTNFQNNATYGLFYNDANFVHNLKNLQFSGNGLNGAVINGGTISEDRSWTYFGTNPYVILNTILIAQGGYKNRLTIKPGSILKFAKNAQFQIAFNSGYYDNRGGELFAEGKADSLILFTALNDSIGGWNGIYFHDLSDWQAGSFSLLKYCKIQKASQYNVFCSYTTQPTIENTIIGTGAGYGLWLDGSSINVKKSIIRNNAGYGVYLTNGSNPVIGNNYITSCDIYNNSYNIYNNTGNNIDMRYNFLGGCDSSYIAKKVWDKSDNSGLGKITFTPFSWLPAAQPGTINFSGKFYYDNNATKPLRNATLTIKDQASNNTIATAQTNSSGAFTFSPIALTVPTSINFTLNDQFGAVNSTDALRVLQHFTYTSLLDANHTFIADVNKSATVNGTDAMMILQRFANTITSFPTGDLQIDCDSVILAPPAFSYNLSALWFGDVNGSYSTLAKTPGMALIYEGAINPGSWQEFSMRVKISNKLDIGAISLHFLYPFEFMDVVGVKLTKTGENLMFTAQEGVLKTGWYNLNPITTLEDEVFVTILFKSKDLSNQSTPISIVLGEESELADGSGQPHQSVILVAPVIPATLTGVESGGTLGNAHSFNFYPNPAKESITLNYSLPASLKVKITITDFFGREIATITDGVQSWGDHSQTYVLSEIPRGVYFIRFQSGDENIPRVTRKLIVQ